MNEPRRLPATARGFLVIVGVTADGTKILLDLTLGIGIVVDPFFISPVTLMIFWITLSHNNIPMFSGPRAWMGWTNLVIAETPGVDAFPDWTVYALSV